MLPQKREDVSTPVIINLYPSYIHDAIIIANMCSWLFLSTIILLPWPIRSCANSFSGLVYDKINHIHVLA